MTRMFHYLCERHPSCVYITAQWQFTAVQKMRTPLKWLSLDLGFFYVHNNPDTEGITRNAHALSLSCNLTRHAQITPLDFCLRVIVNEQPLNLKKTTSSVLSVLLLIYAFNIQVNFLLNFIKLKSWNITILWWI